MGIFGYVTLIMHVKKDIARLFGCCSIQECIQRISLTVRALYRHYQGAPKSNLLVVSQGKKKEKSNQ